MTSDQFGFSYDFWIAIVKSRICMVIGVCEVSEQLYESSLKWWRSHIHIHSHSINSYWMTEPGRLKTAPSQPLLLLHEGLHLGVLMLRSVACFLPILNWAGVIKNNPVHLGRQWYLISKSGWTSFGSGRLWDFAESKNKVAFSSFAFFCPISPEWCIGATQMLIAQECSFSHLNWALPLTTDEH